MSFGLGSRTVGDDTLPRGSLSTICEVCPRCKGEGFKSAVLVAGQWVGGDTYPWVCRRCRGSGGVSFALFPAQQEHEANRLVSANLRRKRIAFWRGPAGPLRRC